MAINEGTGTWTVSTWPWPQIYFGSYYTLGFALVSTNLWLFELYCDTSNVWQGSPIVNLGAVANIKHISIADFHTFYAVSTFGKVSNVVYTDGVIRNPGTGSPLYTALPTSNIPNFGTCCNFNGQGIIGCIQHNSDANFGDAGYNTVMWSRIGRFDFRIYDADGDKVIDPTAGYTHMDWGEWSAGLVYSVRKLGKGVLVLGDGGGCVLTPADSPAVTFGKTNISGIGIPSGNHIAGDNNVAGYIDNNNEFWLMGGDYKPIKLGYKDYFEDLTSANVKVVYIAGKKKFYISDGVTSYGLTEKGLYTTNQAITSGGVHRGILCGFIKDLADYEWRIESDTLDYGQRCLKTLTSMELSGEYRKLISGTTYRDIYGSIKYRYDYKDVLAQTGWRLVNPRGILNPTITASEFRLLFKGADYRGASLALDKITSRIKMVDKRNVRGLYAGKIVAGSGE